MKPLQLDYIINGAKVFIYRRHDGSVYPSLNDYARFGVEPIETIRVKLTETSTAESVLADPGVTRRLAALSPHKRQQGGE